MQRVGILTRYGVDRASPLVCTRCPFAHCVISAGPSMRRHAHSPTETSSPSTASSRRPMVRPRLFVRRGAFSPESAEPNPVTSHKPRRAALPTRTRGAVDSPIEISDSRNITQRTSLPTRDGGSRYELSERMPMASKISNPARDAALNHPSRHLGDVTELDHLPQMPVLASTGKKRVVGWSRGDHAQLLPALHGARSLTINTPYGQLRATPTSTLPAPKTPPFPPQFIRERALDKLVTLMIVATKAKISKLATKRNKSVRDFHGAVDLVVNRGAGLGQEEGGWDLVSTDMVYSIMLQPAALGARVEDMIPHVVKALRALKQMAQKKPFTSGRR